MRSSSQRTNIFGIFLGDELFCDCRILQILFDSTVEFIVTLALIDDNLDSSSCFFNALDHCLNGHIETSRNSMIDSSFEFTCILMDGSIFLNNKKGGLFFLFLFFCV